MLVNLLFKDWIEFIYQPGLENKLESVNQIAVDGGCVKIVFISPIHLIFGSLFTIEQTL